MIVSTVGDFVFDEPIEESLFSAEAPAGYAVERNELSMPSESDRKTAATLVVKPGSGIGSATFGMTQEEAIQKLGKPDRVRSQDGTNVSLDYGSRGFAVAFDRSGLSAIILLDVSGKSLFNRPFTGATDKGIKLGSTSADIIREYGLSDAVGQDQSLMQYRKLGLTCFLRDDHLIQMIVSKPAK